MTFTAWPNDISKAIQYEVNPQYTREEMTLITGQNLKSGTVLGKITFVVPTTGTAGSNTGDGTCTGVAGKIGTKLGTYTLTCIAAATNAGTFAVKDPDGLALPDATVAVAYVNSQINFTLNDGSADFIVGDSFTIPVTAGSGKYTRHVPAAVDGSQKAVAILMKDTDATSADVKTFILDRGPAILASTGITWSDGANAAAIALATAELLTKNIKVRTAG